MKRKSNLCTYNQSKSVSRKRVAISPFSLSLIYYTCSSWKNAASFFRHSWRASDSAAFCEIQCFYGHSIKKKLAMVMNDNGNDAGLRLTEIHNAEAA